MVSTFGERLEIRLCRGNRPQRHVVAKCWGTRPLDCKAWMLPVKVTTRLRRLVSLKDIKVS